MDLHLPIKMKFMREFREAEQAAIGAILRSGVSEGVFRPELDVQRASALIEMSFKAMLMEAFEHEILSESIVETFLDMVLNGVLVKQGK